LHKVYTYIEAQQEKSRIKQFFRQGEMSTLLKDCKNGLNQALEVFEVNLIWLSRIYCDTESIIGSGSSTFE
jgi:hypothetical protein